MAVNTAYLDTGYTVLSSVSITASRATVIAQDVTATSVLSGAALTVSGAVTQSAGTFTISGSGIISPLFASSSTTAQSGATAKLGQGQLYFSVLSLTTNGGEFGFRSGNTVYRFVSTLAG